MSSTAFQLDLPQSSVFLGVALMDRCLAKDNMFETEDPILVAIACLAIAAKVEERDSLRLTNYIPFMPGTYTIEELCKAEITVLAAVDYKVSFITTTYDFITNILASVEGIPAAMANTAFYLGELTLVDYRLLPVSSSIIASACVWYAMSIMPPSAHIVMQLCASGMLVPDEVEMVMDAVNSLAKLHSIRNAISAQSTVV
jgi:hypothetical protein